MTRTYDREYIKAVLPLLEDYLLADDVYWSVNATSPPGEPAFPSLTLGNVLLAIRRVEAYDHWSSQVEIELKQRLDRLHHHWRVAWENKAKREFQARLNLWRDYLEEYRRAPEEHADRYAYEVQRRVLLDLLQGQAGELSQAEIDYLTGLDQALRYRFKLGAFIWEKELQLGFPEGRFWYLYGYLPVE